MVRHSRGFTVMGRCWSAKSKSSSCGCGSVSRPSSERGLHSGRQPAPNGTVGTRGLVDTAVPDAYVGPISTLALRVLRVIQGRTLAIISVEREQNEYEVPPITRPR